MILRDLFLRLRALAAPRRVDRELDEELAFHIERETQKHITAGLSPVDAHARARARFGPVPLAADQCRDARGIGFIDDLARDILYALRSFRRTPLASLTIVATVALGLGLVTAVFSIYSIFVLRIDAVRNPDELFAVAIEQPTEQGSESEPLTWPVYEAMRRETSAFSDAVAMADFVGTSRIEDRFARPILVTGNFFEVLGAQAALGRPLLPDDDERGAGRPVIVLSDVGWHKLFRGDRTVIGRRVELNGAPFEIVGVMPEGFRGLTISPPDYWAPLALAGQFRQEGDGPADAVALDVIGRLKPGVSREAATSAITAWASGRSDLRKTPERGVRVWLTPRVGALSNDDLATQFILFAPLFSAFGLILLIGCANVANLLLARGVSRQREIGIRLTLGASRRRIIRQLLTESLLLALVAAACGFVVSRLILDGIFRAVMMTLPPEMIHFISLLNLAAPSADWRVIVFLVAGAIASTAFFGLAPALQATRLDLVPTMRGEVVRNARPRRARHTLIALQVGASALLLICAVIFLRGAFAAATRSQVARTSDTVRVSIETEKRRPEVLQILRADPLVALMAASSRTTEGVIQTTGSTTRTPIAQMGVSSGYFDVLGFNLVSGRGFTPEERTAEAGVAIVSEITARQLWPSGGAIGQVVRLEAPTEASPDGPPPPAPVRTLTVVGVVRDPGSAPGMTSDEFRGVYLPTAPEISKTWLMLRVRGNPEVARLALMDRLPGLDGGFGVITLRTMSGMQTYILQVGFWIAVGLGGLALVLTVSGLFSVLSYLVEQRAREIGVRMALGAATANVVRLVLSQSLRPVLIGLVAGGGLAAVVATMLMSTPDAAEIANWIDVTDPVAYAASAIVIAMACLFAVSVPALRAARIDPLATLRKD
jgi:predicted permease